MWFLINILSEYINFNIKVIKKHLAQLQILLLVYRDHFPLTHTHTYSYEVFLFVLLFHSCLENCEREGLFFCATGITPAQAAPLSGERRGGGICFYVISALCPGE